MAAPPPLHARDWCSSDIFDCLEVISKKLQSHSLDYVTFRSVCQSWRSAAPKISFEPLLMFPTCPITGTLKFVAPSDGRPFSIIAPEVRNKVLCGLTRGMLVLMDEDLRMSPLNPFTKVAFELPPATPQLATLSGGSVTREGGRWINQPIEGSPVRFELADLPRLFIKEVTLSSPPTSNAKECVAMGVLAASNKVVYCKLGANVWNLADTNLSEDIRSITYSQNKAYIVDAAGNMVTADLGNLPLTIIPHRTPMLTFDRMAFRLLESSNGDILKVTLVISNQWLEDHYKYHYEIHKLVEGDEGFSWSSLEDIGEEVLFISRFYSSHFSGSGIRGCQGNHIYFAEPSVATMDLALQLHHIEIVSVTDGQRELVPCNCTVRRSEHISWFKPDLLL